MSIPKRKVTKTKKRTVTKTRAVGWDNYPTTKKKTVVRKKGDKTLTKVKTTNRRKGKPTQEQKENPSRGRKKITTKKITTTVGRKEMGGKRVDRILKGKKRVFNF